MSDEQIDDLIVKIQGKGFFVAVPYVNKMLSS